MGGLAFASGPDALSTPRMPRQVYLDAKQRCFEALQKHFEVVDSPIDGPGKTDFGDIDILLFGPKVPQADSKLVLEHLQSILGATRVMPEAGEEVSAHFAIPWPHDAAEADQSLPKPESEPSDSSIVAPKEHHIQVDVRVCTSLDRLRWILFKHAHGDAWNLIGTTIRPYGLTVDDSALWLRILEVEKADKKRAKVHLTSDPDQVLAFLDLPLDRFWKGPFDSSHDLFEYVTQCRMFWVKPTPSPSASTQQQQDARSGEEFAIQEDRDGASEDRRKLKANDRRRMNLRPTFRKWVDEFIPECRSRGRFPEPKTSREEVTREAFERFGPEVEREFCSRRKEFLLEQDRLHVWTNIIKTNIPQPQDNTDARALQYRGAAVKAFKKIILEGDDGFGIKRPDDLQSSEGFYDADRVVAFIKDHEAEVGRVAMEKQHASYLEKKARKAQLEAGTSSAGQELNKEPNIEQ